MLMATNFTSTCCVYKKIMVKHNSYQRVQDPYKSTELHYFTQTRDNSIKFKTNHSDITSYNCRIQFDAFMCRLNIIFLLYGIYLLGRFFGRQVFPQTEISKTTRAVAPSGQIIIFTNLNHTPGR